MPHPAGPTIECSDCGHDFHWTESPSLERCGACAAIRAEYLGVSEEAS